MSYDEKIPTQNKQFNFEKMDDEHLLYSPLHTKTVYLNHSAAVVWGLCDGNNTIAQIINLLEESFPESAQQIRSDVINSIDELVNNQAISLG